MNGEQARAAATSEKLDYKSVGFRCGLEIHQQLATRKLFSPCPSGVVEPDQVEALTIAVLDRRLRATQSELGELDPAALAEMRKGKRFRYRAIRGLTSLVETDEEPPHPMSADALQVGLQFAGLLGARPVHEVHVMRKTVIDGSNTSGFQRTSFIAWGGNLHVEGGDVRCQTLSLEEDSARKLDDEGGVVTYTLDRLGIPLLELATEPDIVDPQHAQRTAARIGALLRATGRVRRGLGTIRQDLNVSVAVGTRVEVKGCQDLRAIPRIVEGEVRRQLWMHHVREALAARKAAPGQVVDVTTAFAQTGAKSVKETLARGGRVLALPLPGFAGLLKGATKDGPRLGRELADHAKVAAGVKGIFHSDELPAYGITQDEVGQVYRLLGVPLDQVQAAAHATAPGFPAFALCVESEPAARRALEAVAARAKAAVLPPVGEVRAVQPDDSTRFLRPMPGAARMYPETDVPPIRIAEAQWKAVLSSLPPTPEQRVAQLVKAHAVSQDTAQQLLADGLDREFEQLVQGGTDAGLAGRVLLQYLPALANGERVLARLPEVAAALKAGRFAKEGVEPLLKALDAAPSASLEHAAASAGLGAAADTATVDAVIAKVIAERADFVKARGAAAMGPLMGPVMAELRGKADGAVINARLKAALEKAQAGH